MAPEIQIPVKAREGVRFEFDKLLLEPREYGGLLLYQVGELCCDQGYRIPSHTQWCHEISYVVSGSGSFFCNGSEYKVKSGDLFLSPLGVVHEVRASSQETLRYTYLGFQFSQNEEGRKYGELQRFFESTRAYHQQDMQAIRSPFYLLIDEFYAGRPCGELMIRSTMLQLLVLAMQSFTDTSLRPRYRSESTGKPVGQAVCDVMNYVERNLLRLDSIAQIARDLGYSECYLSHVFRDKTGQTLQSYITQRKIAQSIELFKLGNCSVTAVAEQLGYASVQSFGRAFRRVTGYYPARYMEMYCV